MCPSILTHQLYNRGVACLNPAWYIYNETCLNRYIFGQITISINTGNRIKLDNVHCIFSKLWKINNPQFIFSTNSDLGFSFVRQGVGPISNCFLKAYMKRYIPLETAAIFFSSKSFSKKRVLARSMSWLISFAWAYSGCKERKPRITKWKILVPCGNRNSWSLNHKSSD